MIRRVEERDIPKLEEMGAVFAAFAPYKVDYSPTRAVAMLRHTMNSGMGAAFVNEGEEGINGFVMGALAPVWYAEMYIAVEFALWVEPTSRGERIAKELIREFKEWAKDQGVSYVLFSDLCIDGEFPAQKVFAREGGKIIERVWVVEV